MAWHSAGTYRIADGRGGGGAGQQRFAPLNSWPDNANLDKARRLLVADQAEVRPQDLLGRPHDPRRQRRAGVDGLQDLRLRRRPRRRLGAGPGHLLGRREGTGSATKRYTGERDLENPLAAVQMGLIYVNPEGPNGKPDPLAAARDIRETFNRMAMNDEETVALIAGGHTFGKAHGAGDPRIVGAEPEGAPHRGAGPRLEEQLRHGQRRRHRSPAASRSPGPPRHAVEQRLLRQPVRLRLGADQEPGRRASVGAEGAPAMHRPGRARSVEAQTPTMLTTDLALRMDPAYEKISRRFHEHPEEFADAFARAWFKLTHRDMGPRSRYLGPLVPKEDLIWQDPLPGASTSAVDAADIAALKAKILASGLTVSQLVVDRLGLGLDLPRLRQARRRQRRAHPPRAAEGLGGQQPGAAREVLAGSRAIQRVQRAARAARRSRSPISSCSPAARASSRPRRRRASTSTCRSRRAAWTPAGADRRRSFAPLEPVADGFRNYLNGTACHVARGPAGRPGRSC